MMVYAAAGWMDWVERVALVTGGALPATLAWLLCACALKRLLARWLPAVQYSLAMGLGAVAGLYGCGVLAVAGLLVNAPWVASALSGALLSAVLVAALVMRAKGRLPADTSARLAELQSRIRPHFLFNTINNLYAISLLNPEKAIRIIGRIKAVLQFIIHEIQNEFTALESEISFVKNYIQLEKLRYGNRLKIDFIIDGHIENVQIPPMALFFVVENSFKHGSSPDSGNPWIHIWVKTINNKLSIQVENSKPTGYLKKKPVSQTLANLRKRLHMIYKPGGFKLDVGETENSFTVNLEIS